MHIRGKMEIQTLDAKNPDKHLPCDKHATPIDDTDHFTLSSSIKNLSFCLYGLSLLHATINNNYNKNIIYYQIEIYFDALVVRKKGYNKKICITITITTKTAGIAVNKSDVPGQVGQGVFAI